MRGRRGQPSSSVIQEQPRMALRKELVKDATGIASEIHHTEENTQDDDAVDDKGDKDELSLLLLPPTTARDKRRRERENKSKCKEMTEEEMMDLALRLSEQEASVSASRLKQEEEAVMKAIQESMFSQTEPCPPSQSQSLLPDAEASLRLCSRRKLLYSNRKRTSAITQGALEDDVPPETNSNQEVKTTGDENNNPNKKSKRKEGSPLPEMPDLSQTQRIYSQASPCSSESVILDSPQSSDSTQIEDCQLHKSPVFPLTGCRATVCVPRLSQEVLKTCTTSGFVSCSQDSSTSTQKFLLLKPKSPCFARSPSNITACPQSPVFSETDHGEDGETELSPERGKSPVFGRTTQSETFPSACKPQFCKTSGLMFSSQESLTSTVRSTTCLPKSPVFPGSPSLPNNLPALERSATCKSPVFLETEQGRHEQTHCCSASPVFGRAGQQHGIHPDPKNLPMVPSAVQLKGSINEVDSLALIEPSQSQREDRKAVSEDSKFNKISTSKTRGTPESNKLPKDCNATDTELTSDMTLLWSDDDDHDDDDDDDGDDITPAGSPSPVFPEERPVYQADSVFPSLTHMTATSPATTGSNWSSQGMANRALTLSEEPAAGPLVHYYWGVPFCPRGLDPDSYTQVILAQMEVYEKSLKQAQRCLLRKAGWGEPILPQAEKSPSPESPAESPQPQIPQRYGFRLRGKKLSESADTSPAEEEEEEDKKEEEGEKVLDTENKEKEKKWGGEDKDDTDDCEVCPETQLSNEDNNCMLDPTMALDNESELQTEGPEIEMIQDDSPSADLQVEEEMEVDAPVDAQTEGNTSVRRNDGGQNVRKEIIMEQRLDIDVEDLTERELPRSASPELELAAEVHIDCPICQGSFPVTEIEVHAAYCDGEVTVAVVGEKRPEVNSLRSPLKSRRKKTRRADVSHEETNSHSTTARNHEKCYICSEAVPLRDYSHHTELCIQHQASKTQAASYTKGNLLSALEQTESRDCSDAGPSKLQAGDVIDLRDDDDDDDGDGEGSHSVLAFRVSNSPIRSFTSISEATDCLIDFKTQLRTKKPSKRRR